jgi:hypothetical protein
VICVPRQDVNQPMIEPVENPIKEHPDELLRE